MPIRLQQRTVSSIKALIPPEAFARGIVVCHAGDIIAEAVAQCTLRLIHTGLRHLCAGAVQDRWTRQEAAVRCPLRSDKPTAFQA